MQKPSCKTKFNERKLKNGNFFFLLHKANCQANSETLKKNSNLILLSGDKSAKRKKKSACLTSLVKIFSKSFHKTRLIVIKNLKIEWKSPPQHIKFYERPEIEKNVGN